MLISDERTTGDAQRAPCPHCGAWVYLDPLGDGLRKGTVFRCRWCHRDVEVAGVFTTVRVELRRAGEGDDE